MTIDRIIILVLLAFLCAWACSYNHTVSSKVPELPQSGVTVTDKKTSEFQMVLSSGQEKPDVASAATAKAKAVSLSEAEASAVLNRMPDFEENAGKAKDFALREGSVPAPRAGLTVNQPFPPKEKEAKPHSLEGEASFKDLFVIRYQPEGEVDAAQRLAVTFSLPMVAVTSQKDAALTVPVKMEPKAPGNWRWLGTKTLVFDNGSKRLPMSTTYKVTVPKGIKSAQGKELANELSYSFTTPNVKITGSYPKGNDNPLNPVMLLEFNQDIDRAKLLKALKVDADGQLVKVRLASQSEIDKDAFVSSSISSLQPKRYLAIAPESLFPGNCLITVTIPKDTQVGEGPNPTLGSQSYSFRTYGPFRLEDHMCGWGKELPAPGTPWRLRFSNKIAEESFDPQRDLDISPKLLRMKTSISGNTLTITGNSKGRTTYFVTIKTSLKDVYNQNLERRETVKFEMGSAGAAIQKMGGDMVVLDPLSPPTYSIYTVNVPKLKVELYKVTPKDWDSWKKWSNSYPYDEKEATVPGEKVFDQTIKVAKTPDEFVETSIDLSPALTNGLGHVIAVIEPAKKIDQYSGKKAVWCQATKIGLDAILDTDDLILWATKLEDGTPLKGVELSILGSSEKAGSDDKGLAKLKGNSSGKLLIGQLGQDIAFLPSDRYQNTWSTPKGPDTIRWFVFNDRGIYKPKESFQAKGWVRLVTKGPKGDVSAITPPAQSVKWIVSDPRGSKLEEGTCQLSSFGGFDIKCKIPDNANLGRASVKLSLIPDLGKGYQGTSSSHYFDIQEFRRPEFEVTTKVSQGEHFIGQSAQVTATGSYYAGGVLPGAQTNWTVTSKPTSYSPAGWDDFIFGTWRPWWRCCWMPEDNGETVTKTLQGTTDSQGKHVLNMQFVKVDPFEPVSIKASSAITDVNRQTWSSSSTLLVHPSKEYVGLKTSRNFVEKGQPIVLDAICTDLDGKVLDNKKIAVKTVRLDWEYKFGKTNQLEKDIQETTVTSEKKPVRVKITPKEGGPHRITAVVTDSKGHKNQTQVTVWVAGGKSFTSNTLEKEQVELVPDKKEYKPGETAQVLLIAPFYPAEAIINVAREGIIKTERVKITESTYTIKVPIKDTYLPNVNLQVNLLGQKERENAAGEMDKSLPKRPSYAEGSISLSVPPYQRKLKVDVTPKSTGLAPGEETSVNVKVTNAQGEPMGDCEVALVIADESVLALLDHKINDPIESFYFSKSKGFSNLYSREYVQLANPDNLQMPQANDDLSPLESVTNLSMDGGAFSGRNIMMKSAAPMASNSAEDVQSESPIAIRSNFDPLALFAVKVNTKANGTVTVPVKLPDNLTRYRITAVACDRAKCFGKGTSSLLTRLPLMVRPSAPRFLNFGDVLELPIVVQNQTDKPLDVKLAVRTRNLKLTNGSGRAFTVPANDRLEVRLGCKADLAGQAAFQAGVVSGNYADAAQITLPVWTPGTTEAFATYGQIDKGAVSQPVSQPKDVWPQYGGLEITTSSTALQELTDAVIYLVNYKFDCAEQVSSRVIAISALKPVLSAFKAEGLPGEVELKKQIAADMRRLKGLQNYNGSFSLWKKGELEFPFVSVHCANALIQAQKQGYEVSQDMLERSENYLKQIEKHIPSTYSSKCRWAIQAYALDVLRQMGKADSKKASKLYNEAGVKNLSLESIGWLLPTLSKDPLYASQVEEIRTYLNNRVSETAGSANFTDSYDDGAYLLMSSNRRIDGILLSALIIDQPKNDLIPKIVRGLLSHRKQGRWDNTQENVFILLALKQYFEAYESVTPDFAARLWLGDTFAGKHEFKGRTSEYKETKVPMQWLFEQKNADLILDKEGPGRLYYRIGLKYAPKDLTLDSADYGFTVERTYEAVDNKEDVRLENGQWKVKLGSRVRTTVTMVAPSRRYHVALTDPLPAGFEIINTNLLVSEEIPTQKSSNKDAKVSSYRSWFGPWYEHSNQRDERAEAFASLLWEGVYEYSYISRATTPGTFVVPPSKAEEMYSPETFGRSQSNKVIVY